MANLKRAAASWSDCKRAVKGWPRPGLVSLLRELYKLSPENQRFLHARLLDERARADLDEARRAIGKLLGASAVFNDRFRHSDVKRIVDDYAKASGDTARTAALLVSDLDYSCATLRAVGDSEQLVDHIDASMRRLHETLELVEQAAAGAVVEELSRVATRWSAAFGYGVSDELMGLAAEWQERLARRRPSSD